MPRPGRFLKALLVLVIAAALSPGLLAVVQGRRLVMRGVNDSGGEWDYAPRPGGRYSTPRTLDWLARRGLRLVRLPFRWENVQPVLGGPLRPDEVDQLRRYVDAARARGLEVILDVHNAARYSWVDADRRRETGVIGDRPVTIPRFADFWRRMATAFKDEGGIYAYDLMNEPHDIVTHVWERASQAALDAIRATGDRHCVLVEGSNYASAQTWVMCHGWTGWIRDPSHNFAYEAHVYFDASGSARYSMSYAAELARDPGLPERGVTRLRIFADWCRDNGVRGFVGEFGVPDDPSWLAMLDRTLGFMDREHLDGTIWAAGERWREDYPLSVQPLRNFTEDRPQMRVLLRHRGGGATGSAWYDFRQEYVSLWRRTRREVAALKRRLRGKPQG